MADTKDQVVEATEIVEETTDNQTEALAQDNSQYGFSQEQVDEVVAKRLARERDAIAKKFGVDKYEALDSFLETYNNTIEEGKKVQELSDQYVNELFDRELRLTALTHGVQAEHLERTIRLAVAELESVGDDDDLDITKAIENVLNDFPMFKGAEQPVRRVGVEPKSDVSEKTEIDRYLDKYKNSKYINK